MRSTNASTDQDPQKEKCQEGDPVLFDGLRRFRDWYDLINVKRQYAIADVHGVGRTTFVNTLCGKQVLEGKNADDADNAHIEEGVKIKPITVGQLQLQNHHLMQNETNTTQSLNLTTKAHVSH